MKLKTSIRTRFFLSILLCLLPIHAILVYSFVSRFDGFFNERIVKNLDDGLNVVRTQFNSRLVEMRNAFLFPASSPEIQQHIMARDTAWLTKSLRSWNNILPYVDFMAIVDTGMRPLALRNLRDIPDNFKPLLEDAIRKRLPVVSVELVSCSLLGRLGSHPFCEIGKDSSVLAAISVTPVIAPDGRIWGGIISADVINNDPFLRHQVESIFGNGIEAVITQGEVPIVGSLRSEKERSKFRISRAIMTRLAREGHFRDEALIGGIAYRTAIAPLRNIDGSVVGTILVALHDKDYRVMRRQNLGSIVGMLAVGTPLLFLMALYLARRFTRPLKDLIAGAEKIGRGDFEHRTMVRSGDELEILADAFNRMSLDLADRDRIIRSNTVELESANSRLSQMNEGLERVVAQRTMELQREKRWLEAILSCLSEGLLVFDGNASISLANPAARDILDLNSQGETDGEAVRGVMTGRVRKHIDALRSGQEKEPWEDKLEMNGKRLKVILSPLTDINGDLSGVIMSLRDVSVAATIDEMKRDFISKISHELKTPLTSIRGALHFMLEHPNQSGQAEQELVSICYRNTERLMRLINDILDLSKMEAGKMSFNLMSRSIWQIVSLACEEISGYAMEHGIKLVNMVDNGLPPICGDDDRLVQVISNLLSNAIKFSPRDTMVVIKSELRDDMVEISVIDEGHPIQWLDRERLFHTFQQLDSSQGYVAGTGLGLAICKEIVERHGGRIYYSPATPKGNRFAFTLPLSHLVDGKRTYADDENEKSCG